MIAAAVLLALHLGKALFFLADGQPPLRWDSGAYWRLGQLLAAGEILSPEWLVERPPAYPLLLAAFQRLFGDRALVAVVAFHQLSVAMTALLAAWICGRLTGSRVAFLLGLALPLACVERHYLASQVLSDHQFSLELVGALALLILWLERPRIWLAGALGLVFGLATLGRPVAQLAWLPVLAVMALRARGGRARPFLAHAGCLLAAMGVLIVPWALRNHLVHGEAFLVKFSGRSSWISVFEQARLPFAKGPATSAIEAAVGRDVLEQAGAWALHQALQRAGYTAIESDDRMGMAVREAVIAQPLAFLRSVADRFGFFWTSPLGDRRWRELDWSNATGYRGQRTWEVPRIVALHDRIPGRPAAFRQRVYGWTVLAALLGAALMARQRALRLPVLAIVLLALYVAALTAVMTVPLYRFRMVLEPLFAVLVASGAERGVRGLGGRWRPCLLAGLLLLAGCRREPTVLPGQSVVLISIDTLRADHLGSYGYPRPTSPNLDALARSAIVFERAYSQSPNTIVSHATMLTSLSPPVHGVTVEHPLAANLTTLAESFQELGYATAGFTTHGTWLNEKMGFAQGFDTFHSKYLSAPKNNERVFEWLRAHAKEPFFLFVHYYDVHSDYRKLPYETRPEYDGRFTGGYRGSFDGCRDGVCGSRLLGKLTLKDASLSAEDLAYIEGLYDGGIAFTDHEVGRLFAELQALGRMDDTIVVVTSDHGEQFGEHGGMLHFEAYEEVSRVPLILELPGRSGQTRVRELVGTFDIMPTLLDLVGAPREGLQGRSLVPLIDDGEVPHHAMVSFPKAHDASASADRYTELFFRDGRYSLLARQGFTDVELYDVRRDPGEQHDIAAEQEAVARQLLARSKDLVAEQMALQERVAPGLTRSTVSAQEEEILRSLGYLE